MLNSKQFKLCTALLGLTVAIPMASAALATSPSGITPTTFVAADYDGQGHINSDRIKFQTKGPTDVSMQKLVFAAGARSGWHHHPGMVIVAVQSGRLTLTDANCGSKDYGPGLSNGAVFVEGGDMAVEASSAAGAIVYVTSIAPSTDPRDFRDEDSPPTCH
ncbi:MAG: hypothetical protein H0W65_04210 [Sphingomonas sp.]|uniref:hypothetical protein n=1 Tax=Sphingomonas sp. TaxID=28214 RepID=UPI0017AD0DC7|nr:hypothetical protein [Sphingomonas sp.]MBA3666910.1 hypothetical protein [Sphingomonas sp.]